MSSNISSPRIAIIGCGPAGLALARLLLINGVQSTLFEKEPHESSRAQGGSLDLHPETGQRVLKEAGLWDEFEKFARYDGQDIIIADHQDNRIIDIKNIERGKPEIDRVLLRQLLLESLPESNIKWNHRLRWAEPGVLHFEHVTESGFDLIVGADGAWSKIRPLVSDVSPFYSGISAVSFKVSNIDKKLPETSQWLGRGSYFAFNTKEYGSIKGQRSGDGSFNVYTFGRKPPGWELEFKRSNETPDKMKKTIIKDHSDWDPKFKPLFDNMDDDVGPRSLYMLPPGLRWPHRSGVTLIGDAAHLMTPFGGEGVNTAMTDALVLAKAIIENLHDLDVAIKKYEQEMFVRAHEVTAMTWAALHTQFGDGVFDFYKQRLAQHPESSNGS